MLVEQNLGVGRHVGFQFSAGIVDRYPHLKRGYVVFFHAHWRNLRNLSVKCAVSEAFNLDARGLGHVHVRDVGFVNFALHIHFVDVSLSHYEGCGRPEHEDGADSVADFNVSGQDHAVHRRDNGGVAHLFFKLFEAGLALLHLGSRLFQLGQIHADLRLR